MRFVDIAATLVMFSLGLLVGLFVGKIKYAFKVSNVVVTSETKLYQNYFCRHRRPTEIILFQRVENCLKLFVSEAACLSLIHI